MSDSVRVASRREAQIAPTQQKPLSHEPGAFQFLEGEILLLGNSEAGCSYVPPGGMTKYVQIGTRCKVL